MTPDGADSLVLSFCSFVTQYDAIANNCTGNVNLGKVIPSGALSPLTGACRSMQDTYTDTEWQQYYSFSHAFVSIGLWG